jgi:hypothetical protein
MPLFRTVSKLVIGGAIVLGGIVLLPLAFVGALNSELYGRLTETQTVSFGFLAAETDPLVRLVVHKIIPDENAVEASLILMIDGSTELGQEIKIQGVVATAIVEDGSSQHFFAVTAQTPPIDSSAFEPGSSWAVTRSERFLLPTYPSMGTYPFDDIRFRPMLNVRSTRDGLLRPRVEIQKALPGRLLAVTEEGGCAVISLTRAPTEKAFVLASSLIFVLISLAVTFGVFFGRSSASSFEQLVAVASYLLAAAGFRELLGVSRVTGTTILEVLILGVPLTLLAIGVGASLFRHYRQTA